jgi:heterogeneous nuclear ribonucleoprotein M
MDVITRGELDDSMKNLLTKDELSQFVSAIRETLKEKLGDLKVDLSAQIDERVKRSHSLLELHAVTRSDLKDAKNEILATMRRNISEEIDPLKAELHQMGGRVAKMEERIDKVAAQVDKMGERVDKMGAQVDKLGAQVDKLGPQVDKLGAQVDKTGAAVDEMGARLHKMGARVDEMHATFKTVADGHLGLSDQLTRLGNEMRERFDRHERILDRHDADLFKLRQSGVLN